MLMVSCFFVNLLLMRFQVPLMKYSFKEKELQKTRYPLFKVFPVLLGLVSSWLLCAILTAAANNNSPGNFSSAHVTLVKFAMNITKLLTLLL